MTIKYFFHRLYTQNNSSIHSVVPRETGAQSHAAFTPGRGKVRPAASCYERLYKSEAAITVRVCDEVRQSAPKLEDGDGLTFGSELHKKRVERAERAEREYQQPISRQSPVKYIVSI